MAGDEELLVDDKDVFAAALSDQPPAEAPVEAEAEPKPEGDRPRDEQGRFIPKAADAETPAPVTGEKPPPEGVLSSAEEKPAPEEAIPSWRLREETARRREAEEERAALRAQVQQLMQHVQQQRERQQQQPPELPDFIEQPKEFAQAIEGRALQAIEQFRVEMEQREIRRSLQRADQAYGEEFREAYIAFNSQAVKHDERLYEQVRNSYEPGETILAWHRQQKAMQEIGDPKTYRQRLKAELKADPEFVKEFGEELRSQATRRPSSVTSLPNLARAPGSASGPRDEYPTDEAGIFQSVTAGLNRR